MQFDYDVAVIGAGSSGLQAAKVADSLGAKVVLIEGNRVGGEDLWRGAVQTKTLVKSAKVFDLVKRSEEFGVHLEKPRLIWNALKLRLADMRDEIKKIERDSLTATNIEVVTGLASFVDGQTLSVEGKTGQKNITAAKFILATGSRPLTPAYRGLEEVDAIHLDGLFERPNLPKSLIFIGDDPIAVELAQAFCRFGTKVTFLATSPTVLPNEEAEISELVTRILENEGMTIHLNVQIERIEPGESQKTVVFRAGAEDSVEEDSAKAGIIVIAAGRTPHFETLNLEAAGVHSKEGHIILEPTLRTSAHHIYACGDVTGELNLGQVGLHQAQLAAQNAVRGSGEQVNMNALPWVTSTDPEVARVGLTQAKASQEHPGLKVWRAEFKNLQRAIIEGETSGFVQILTSAEGRILGVHIVGLNAGELITPYLAAVREGEDLHEFLRVTYPYLSLSEISQHSKLVESATE